MRILSLSASGVLLLSHVALSQEWKNECVGYYQMQMPDNLEVALYPVEDLLHPKKQPESDGDIKTRQYASPGVTFGETYSMSHIEAIQAQFSEFYYDGYELDISSESQVPIDFADYKERVKNDINFSINVIRQYEEKNFRQFNDPMTPKAEFDRKHGYLIKDYPDAFVDYDNRGYTIYRSSGKRLYQFWGNDEKDTGDKSQTAERQVQKSEPEVLSLLSRFKPRRLYEVPAAQGFCIPYGFIAGDSGHEPRNMAVTYRLKDHPDVTIFFQDLGMEPGAGFQRPENESAKDFVLYLWNRKYQLSAAEKELIKPKWRAIKMDGRDGLGTFAKAIYRDVPVYDYNGHVSNRLNYTSYGYVAYVQGDHNARNLEPDLLLYVMQDSRQARNNKPMDKDEIEKIAEHIIGSVKRR